MAEKRGWKGAVLVGLGAVVWLTLACTGGQEAGAARSSSAPAPEPSSAPKEEAPASPPSALGETTSEDSRLSSDKNVSEETPSPAATSEEGDPADDETVYAEELAIGRTSTVHDSRGRSYEMVTVLPKDAIPAILDPRFLSAEEAGDRASGLAKALTQLAAASGDPAPEATRLINDELVIGVSINGDHRAYSVPYLSRHEVVNDIVGGKPVAVTW